MASTKRITSLDFLHPVVRKSVADTLQALKDDGHPFELFETYRTPQRQASLYAQGRTTKGPKVTNAGPWSSYHQYGLAADFVLFIGGDWSWDTSGDRKAHWEALQKIGKQNGLEPLSWELPHLQLAGTSASELRKGRYPAFGDEDWSDNLADMIEEWTGGGAPPKPPTIERPPLSSADAQEEEPASDPSQPDVTPTGAGEEEVRRGEVSQTGEDTVMATETFSRIQAIVDKWEGGYVNHPSDPGGPTNMGITQATLSRWRGRSVTVQEVKDLSRDEQRKIMKAFYYDVVNGDQLPAPVATVVYNAAILHGPGRAGKFFQTTLNNYGAGLAVDGVVGQNTIAACATQDPGSIATDFISVEMTYLRGLKNWSTFGKGWEARLNDVKVFATKLADESRGSVPASSDRGSIPTGLTPPPKPEIGPVGALFGQRIGKLLDGSKTNLGLGGLVLSALGQLPEADKILAIAPQASPYLAAVSALMTGWGLVAKVEKEVRQDKLSQ